MSLVLNRLALADVIELVRNLDAAGMDLPDGIGGGLYHETEGLPLFLAAYVETLARGSERGEGGEWPVPRGVVDLLRSRLDAVGDAARQVLQAAAVIGRSFDLEALQAGIRRKSRPVENRFAHAINCAAARPRR